MNDDDSMFDEFVTDDVAELENTPVNSQLDDIQRDVAELLTILRPLNEVISSLPAAMEQITPLIDGLRDSPVLKMLGIRLP